ncbi:MAG: endonuclease III [Bdellovibrionales bacterium]|nr:endonuclease III [Bdellovibrionales bacterium]
MRSLEERKKRALYILDWLNQRYPDPTPPLDHQDPFTFLVAVALSAQTTDARVNLVTPALFKEAPTPEAMARIGSTRILHHIKTCGLAPTKAKNLEKMSKILIEKFAGRVPNCFEDLESLPGVGHKTASVVMSQIFNVPAFPVDTHVFRLAKRWKLSRGHSVGETEKHLKQVFPAQVWSRVSLQIIFYGREFCTARGCDGKLCPICNHLNDKPEVPESTYPQRQTNSRRRNRSLSR